MQVVDHVLLIDGLLTNNKKGKGKGEKGKSKGKEMEKSANVAMEGRHMEVSKTAQYHRMQIAATKAGPDKWQFTTVKFVQDGSLPEDLQNVGVAFWGDVEKIRKQVVEEQETGMQKGTFLAINFKGPEGKEMGFEWEWNTHKGKQ